jgi:hypothetical protein
MRIMNAAALGSIVAVALWNIAPAHANSIPGQDRCGRVVEISQVPADFIVNLTDINGNNLVKYGWPKTLTGVLAPDGTYRAETRTPCFSDIYDARNTTIPKVVAGGGGLGGGNPVGPGPGGAGVPPGGGVGGVGAGYTGPNSFFDVFAELSLEAVFQDPDDFEWHLENIWGAIEGHVGINNLVRVPDLYRLDENGYLVPDDGTDATRLYSLVDFNIYLHNVFNFQRGDIFYIENGVNPLLPGMYFSTTPFTFTPENGFQGTPYTGNTYALTEHGLEVPEPGTLALFAGGLLSAGWLRRRRVPRKG